MPSGENSSNQAINNLAKVWASFSSAEPSSQQAGELRNSISDFLRQIPPARRTDAMAAMMDVQAEHDSRMNQAAILIFGENPLEPPALAALLAEENPSPAQRYALMAFFSILEMEKSTFTPPYQSAAIAALCDRLIALKGKELPPARQELLADLCRSALINVSRSDKPTEQSLAVYDAFKRYYNTAPAGLLETTLKDWLKIMKPEDDLSWSEQQLLMLTHWDTHKQSKAALSLGRATTPGGDVAAALERLLSDPRTDVRTQSAVALRFSSDPLTDAMAERLIAMLKSDPAERARREAAFALAVHAGDSSAAKAAPVLLEILEDPNTPATRLIYVWQCLKRFLPAAPTAQRSKACKLAVSHLGKCGVTALEAIKLLGPDGAPAAEALQKYRPAASTAERELIDAILKQWPATQPQ